MHITTTKIHPQLPIFRLDYENKVCLHTTGYSYPVTLEIADILQNYFNNTQAEQAQELGLLLIGKATQAQQSWKKLSQKPFNPICLTVYLSNQCNLACSYCFAAPARLSVHDQSIISEEDVIKAAQIVAKNCINRDVPFTLVLHGGGEPTLHWQLLKRLVAITRQIAADHNIGWWGYIATNGVLTERKVEWLAKHFNLVGLSCDGPPIIQNMQRTTIKGGNTAKIVERTAKALVKNATPFVIRATITPDTCEQQADIVRYIYEQLGTKIIRFEPAFHVKYSKLIDFGAKDAELFVNNFLAAQQLAKTLGCDLSLSGVRPNEIHGPYCNILRDVLQITPDGTITACFLSINKHYAIKTSTYLGQVNSHLNKFTIDERYILEMRNRATLIPNICQQCINIYHCAHGCPDFCPVAQNTSERMNNNEFYCKIYKKLTEIAIMFGGTEIDSI